MIHILKRYFLLNTFSDDIVLSSAEIDHENEMPLDLGENFDPPTAKRSKPDENSNPLPRRSLRTTPARQQTAGEENNTKLQKKDATPQPEKERRSTQTLAETPKEGRRQTRTQSLGSEKPVRHEAKTHNQSKYSVCVKRALGSD